VIRDDLVQRCDAYLTAVETKNTDALIALFAADARQYEPIGSEPNVGHDAIRAFFTRNPTVQLKLDRMGPVTVAGRYAAMQVRVEVDRDGARARLTTTDVIEFDEDGLIVSLYAIPDRDADPDVV